MHIWRLSVMKQGYVHEDMRTYTLFCYTAAITIDRTSNNLSMIADYLTRMSYSAIDLDSVWSLDVNHSRPAPAARAYAARQHQADDHLDHPYADTECCSKYLTWCNYGLLLIIVNFSFGWFLRIFGDILEDFWRIFDVLRPLRPPNSLGCEIWPQI